MNKVQRKITVNMTTFEMKQALSEIHHGRYLRESRES